LLQSLLSLAGGALGAFLAAQLALRHYFTQRVWDRRADAYTAIFEALEAMADVCRADVAELVRGADATDDVQQERLNSYRAAFGELKAVLGRETWIISDRVRERLEEYRRRGRNNEPHQGWADYALGELEAIEALIDDLRDLAREDMHVPRRTVLTRIWPLARRRTQAAKGSAS
jgi:hypothetical protein